MLSRRESIDRNDPWAIFELKSHKNCQRWKQLKFWRNTRPRLIAYISEGWSLPYPSCSGHNTSFSLISLKGENMIPPIDCCINVLPSDERWGVLCFYVIRLTSSWERALASCLVLLQCQGACDRHLGRLVLLCVLFVWRYHPGHFTDQQIMLLVTEACSIHHASKSTVGTSFSFS